MDQTRQGVPSSCSQTHTYPQKKKHTRTHIVCGLEISRGQFDKAHPPTHNKTHAHKVCTHLYALHSSSLNSSLLLSRSPLDTLLRTHTHTHIQTPHTHTQTESTPINRSLIILKFWKVQKGAQSRSDSSVWNSSFFIQIYKKKKYNRNKYTLFSTQLWNCINIVQEQWSHGGKVGAEPVRVDLFRVRGQRSWPLLCIFELHTLTRY